MKKPRQILKHALELNPKYAESYVLMGYVESLHGEDLRAIEFLDYAKYLGSNNPWINNNKGRIYLTQELLEEAEIEYALTVKLGVGETAQNKRAYIDALYQLMKISAVRGNIARLRNLAKQATETTSRFDAWTWSNAGILLCRMGDLHAGSEYIRKAISIKSDDLVNYNLAFCLYGQWAKNTIEGNDAGHIYDEAYAIYPDIKVITNDFIGTQLEIYRKPLLQKIEELTHGIKTFKSPNA